MASLAGIDVDATRSLKDECTVLGVEAARAGVVTQVELTKRRGPQVAARSGLAAAVSAESLSPMVRATQWG